MSIRYLATKPPTFGSNWISTIISNLFLVGLQVGSYNLTLIDICGGAINKYIYSLYTLLRFIEGDFDTYVSHIRKTHVWGGEPELLMAAHVLKMPIAVYMSDPDSGGLVSVAEYGQEYSKQDPIRVLYDGSGHYDALHIPIYRDPKSRL